MRIQPGSATPPLGVKSGNKLGNTPVKVNPPFTILPFAQIAGVKPALPWQDLHPVAQGLSLRRVWGNREWIGFVFGSAGLNPAKGWGELPPSSEESPKRDLGQSFGPNGPLHNDSGECATSTAALKSPNPLAADSRGPP